MNINQALDYGIWFNTSEATSLHIIGPGSITGFMSTGTSSDTLLNSGSITGRINMGAGNDHFTNLTEVNIDLGFTIATFKAGHVGGIVKLGAGNDTATGNGQNETFAGGTGNDRLTGGGGNDTFVFTNAGKANADVILDFNKGDTIALEDSVFRSLRDGIDAGEITQRGGSVIYDADGDGGKSGVVVAHVGKNIHLTMDDFAVI